MILVFDVLGLKAYMASIVLYFFLAEQDLHLLSNNELAIMNPSLNAGILLSLVEIIGDYGAKIRNPTICFLGYNALAWTLYRVLATETLTLVNANWDGVSNVLTMFLGMYMGERFTQRQYVGLFMISAGLFLINSQ